MGETDCTPFCIHRDLQKVDTKQPALEATTYMPWKAAIAANTKIATEWTTCSGLRRGEMVATDIATYECTCRWPPPDASAINMKYETLIMAGSSCM